MSTETEQRTPRVWIGCLAAYNAGSLHGQWVDVPEDVDDLHAEIKRVLAASPVAGAEEWFFADNEDFHPWQPGEFPPLEKLVIAAELIREKGEAAAVWLGYDDSPLGEADDYRDLEEKFDESYAGAWENDEAYARAYVGDCGLPGIGFLHPETRGDYGDSVRRGSWSDTLDQIDGLLDWDAVFRYLDDVWSDRGYYFRSY